MFKENKLTNVTFKVKNEEELLKLNLSNTNKVFSYIVYKFVDYYEIQCNISQINKYNTIKLSDEINTICVKIQNGGDLVLCYKQPSLELLIKLYKPLVLKLSKEQKERWRYLEMEDLIQMCNLVICDLYYKGYYVHKNLIRTSFINYVLSHIRKNKSKPKILSLEQMYSKSDDDNEVRLADMIPDEKLLNEQDDNDIQEVYNKILHEMKDIVIDYIGIRQYDQLLREYSNNQTTDWSRKLMQRIKAHLFELGISSKSFNKYFE